MSSSSGFCDLCVDANEGTPQILERILSRLHKLGYDTVAVNQTVDENVFETEKKNKKKSAESEIVKSSAVAEPLDTGHLKEKFKGKLRILSRITYVFGDTAKVHSLSQSAILKKYDLYGVVPKTQTALQYACAQLSTDIITVKSTHPRLKLTRKLYLQAVERGVHFEIQYADLIKRTTRIDTFECSHSFHIFGKSKNVIVSSGAKNETLLRNPYDVMNLGFLMGLDEVKAKASIFEQCKDVLLKAGDFNGPAKQNLVGLLNAFVNSFEYKREDVMAKLFSLSTPTSEPIP